MNLNLTPKPKSLGTNGADAAPTSSNSAILENNAARASNVVANSASGTKFPYKQGDMVEGLRLKQGTVINGARERAVVTIEGGKSIAVPLTEGSQPWDVSPRGFYRVIEVQRKIPEVAEPFETE
tara:strand:- start:964 stop:1335 length:372 start_codon:yes stop_codon:yes gene_type:complete